MAGLARPRQIPRSARNDRYGRADADEADEQRRPDDAQAGAADGGVGRGHNMGTERQRILVIPRSPATRNLEWGQGTTTSIC